MSQIGERPGERAEQDAELRPDEAGARWLRQHIASGVGVVTTVVSDGFRGATVSAFCCVSQAPLMVLVSIDHESQMANWLEESKFFALSILPASEQFLADQFAGFTPRASRSFQGMDHIITPSGSPILTRSIAWVDCRRECSFDSGDHRCLIGQVSAMGRGLGDETDPLIHYLSHYPHLR